MNSPAHQSSNDRSQHVIPSSCGDKPPLPIQSSDGPVFAQPWQAQAFAMTLQLHASGLFTWPEWAALLSAEIHAVPDVESPSFHPGHEATESADQGSDDGSRYYTHWLNALEKLLIAKSIGSAKEIHALEHAWEAAAQRTPHGQAIVLLPGQ